MKRAADNVVSILKTDPVPFSKTDVCKLKGYGNVYRIIIDDLRIVYEV